VLLVCLSLILINFTFGLEVFSDYLERQPDGWILAKGNVETYHKSYYIKADSVRYNPETKEIIAEGNVFVRSLDGKLEAMGSYAYLNLEEDAGYYLNAQGRFERFYFWAKSVEKSGDVYVVKEGEITTCPPDRKEMVLCFSRARIDDKYVFSTNNSLKLFKIPIAYLPISLYPVGDRRSGLLPPTIGSNSFNTFIYQQPVYWAISRDKDLTLTLDFRDKQAKGSSLEYRQAIFKENDLQFHISYYREPKPAGEWWQGRDFKTFRQNRYSTKLSLALQNFKAGLEIISDPYFLEDTSLRKEERTRPYVSSYVSYKNEFDRFSVSFEAKHFYDTTSPNNKRTLHKLPELSIYWKPQPIIRNLFFSAYSSYTNFYREEGLRGQRILLLPEISIPKNIMGKVFYSRITFENFYYFGLNQKGYKNNVFSFFFSEKAPFIFDLKKGNFEMKNFFEASYSFREKDFNNPRFDNLDNLKKQSQIDLAFRNSISYKEREFLNLYFSSAYNYLGKYTYLGSTVERKILPVRAIASLKPLEHISLYTDSLYDVKDGFFLSTSNGIRLEYGKTNFSIGRLLTKDFQKQIRTDQTSLSLNASYKSITFGFSLTRDNRIDKDLIRQVNINHDGPCWSFGILARDNYDGTRGRYIKEVYLTFNIFDLQRFTVPLRR